VKPPPEGWTRISSTLFYDDAAKAIDWLCDVLGFELRLKVEGDGGTVVHSELALPGGLIMVGQAGSHAHAKSPRSAGGCTQALLVHVDDADALCQRIEQAGGKITTRPQTNDYGEEYWSDRTFGAEDLEGHHWWFGQRMTTGKEGWESVRGRVEKKERG
jgi:uncharacterized glyoxalase superfamily protein PhnB